MKKVDFLKTSLKCGALSSNLFLCNAMNKNHNNKERKYTNNVRIYKKAYIDKAVKFQEKSGKNFLITKNKQELDKIKKNIEFKYSNIDKGIFDAIKNLQHNNSEKFKKEEKEKKEKELYANFKLHEEKILMYYEYLEYYLKAGNLYEQESDEKCYGASDNYIERLMTLLNDRYKKIEDSIKKILEFYKFEENINNIENCTKYNKILRSFFDGINYISEKEKLFENIYNTNKDIIVEKKIKELKETCNIMNIGSKYIIKEVLSYISTRKKLELLRYNKLLQGKLEINVSNYIEKYEKFNKKCFLNIGHEYYEYCSENCELVMKMSYHISEEDLKKNGLELFSRIDDYNFIKIKDLHGNIKGNTYIINNFQELFITCRCYDCEEIELNLDAFSEHISYITEKDKSVSKIYVDIPESHHLFNKSFKKLTIKKDNKNKIIDVL